MREMLKKKAMGFYVVLLSLLIGVVSLIRFVLWAPAHDAMDFIVAAGLIVGIGSQIVLLFRDIPYLKIVSAAAYAVAATKILTDGIGSFIDAYQKIKMFGDASQVENILSIALVLMLGAVLAVAAGFMRLEKDADIVE